MAAITVEQGKEICSVGAPMTSIALITAGEIEAGYPGGTFALGKGDVIGICETCNEVHFLSYRARQASTLVEYPLNNMDVLQDILEKHPDLARVFLSSLFRQITFLLNQCSLSEIKCSDLYSKLTRDIEQYYYLCDRYRVTVRKISGMDEVDSCLVEEAPDMWLTDYYGGLGRAYSTEAGKALCQDAALSMGMLRKGSLDSRKAYQILDGHFQYRQQMGAVYFAPGGEDLYDAFTALFQRMDRTSADAETMLKDLRRIEEGYRDTLPLDREPYAGRIGDLEAMAASRSKAAAAPAAGEETPQEEILPAELTGSLDTILKYAEADEDTATSFAKHIRELKKIGDIDSMEDDVVRLRRVITQEFYIVYTAAFMQTLQNRSIPPAVKLFLYFGFVDEELAGEDNTLILARIAGAMKDQSASGVYTLYDWLMAVYRGKKDPSRDEFDSDYLDTLHKQKIAGIIDAKEEKMLAANPTSRVSFELKNMFPQVNKMTFGRITTFCPVFAAKNVLKDLDRTLVTVSELGKALSQIRKIDYTAFYRETLDTQNIQVMQKETIHLEFLPDFILLPNVGVRGVMWQEIEGKVRNSPARMCLSIFHMEDLLNTMVRLTGEFRWELCKRIQGARWNDVTDRSLTSEYFDYVQFYRKNHDLSAEAKEKVRVALQRAKNSFKEMFVRDYMIWVLFEGTGSPRMNKVARQILYTYCPFTEENGKALGRNPIYAELMQRGELQKKQKLNRLELFKKKLESSGIPVPDTLVKEMDYIAGRVS
ncbi:MAG: Crp/Fnr family transcriptional regulator [Lachnospiraceae bacterium]|nr:Crp/Fnr family transcriptional regulator [Lachnospiraceae bacterium]